MQDPRCNPKLKAVLEKINGKIGWKTIKEAVQTLVTVCGTNYRRELDGQLPLPVFLNRLFLGNPGTGNPESVPDLPIGNAEDSHGMPMYRFSASFPGSAVPISSLSLEF